MNIKRYSIASILFIALVGWYVTTFVSNEDLNINIFGVVISSIPVSIWVVIPLVFLFLASVLHMSVYSVIGTLKLRKYEKDYETMIDSIIEAYLGKENRSHVFKTQTYQVLGTIIDNAKLSPDNLLGLSVDEHKIQEVIELIRSVKNGNVVDLKKFSLPSDNYLVMQNNRNRYALGEVSDEDILSHSNDYDKEFVQEVYANFIQTAQLKDILKYKQFLTKDALFNMLSRVNTDENTINVSNETLLELFAMLELTGKDYITISSIMSCCMVPEQRMKLFETLSNENEEAMDAYLFTLFDLEMIAPADAILDVSKQDEYMNFKAYRALKENNLHYNINLFI